MTPASSTASTAYPCPDTPRIVLFTLFLNMSCSSAVAVLRGTGLGLEYERPRRAQDPPQRAWSGVPAGLPPDHPAYHVQTPRRRPEPVPRGIPARPPHYLLERLRVQDLLPSSRLPVKPSAQAAPHHPDEPAANGRVRPRQFACDEPYSIALLALAAGDQGVPGLAGGRPFDHAAKVSVHVI